MKWILIFLTSVNGEISVEVVDTYAHMAVCYQEKTIRDWDIVTANEKLVCFPIGGEDEEEPEDQTVRD